MPYAAIGSVGGCGLAPGPALQLVNWTGWVLWFIQSIVFKIGKLPFNHGELEDEPREFGWKGYLALFEVIGYLAAVCYSLYDLIFGYKIGISGPNAILTYLFFLREYGVRVRGFARSLALYSPVVFLFTAWIVEYVVSARGAGIIVDKTKLSGCLATAQEYLDIQDLGLKRSIPAVMATSNFALVVSDFAWRSGKLDGDIFFMWTGYIVFGVITLVLHLIDAFVGVGAKFECGGCSVSSGLGYYNYRVNWYETRDGARRQGHGSWYVAQNAFQS